MKKRMALLFGGEGFEREVSKKSAAAVYPFIKKTDYELDLIYLNEDGRAFLLTSQPKTENGKFVLNDDSLLPLAFTYRGFLCNGEYSRLDLVFPLLHGDYGEDGALQGLLSSLHIPYIGEDVYTSALCQDKAYTKAVARLLSIPTADWILLTESDPGAALKKALEVLSFPLFIKPARLGSSIGASPVYSEDDFIRKYKEARKLSERVLVEEKIDTEYELECAFLSSSKKDSYAVGKVDTEGRFYDYSEKYDDSSLTTTSTSFTNTSTASLIIKYSEELRKYIGIKRISRFDFLLSKSGKIYFSEINTIPGMTKTSLFPKLCEAMGYKEGEFISHLISLYIG